jgi:MGT family glycosyltransferase
MPEIWTHRRKFRHKPVFAGRDNCYEGEQMKIGFLSLPLFGHLNPMTALARKLQSRGHEVVFLGIPDVEAVARAANLTFIPFCEKQYPVGSQVYGPVAKLRGEAIWRVHMVEITPPFLKTVLENLPERLAELGVDGLVIDAAFRFVQLVPMSLGIPFVQIWNPLHLDSSGTSPACIFSWPFENTPESRVRNIEGLRAFGYLAPTVAVAKPYAEKAGLLIDWSDPHATASKLAVITQTPKEFDFPGIPWPAQFHYAGPFHDDQGREPVAFPWEKLTGKPLIYASLGTLVNGLEQIYKTILAAVRRLPDVQVVLSLGKNVNPEDLGPVPSNTIVVRIAPQIELLKRAALCITHAGLNTALESLGQGVPMVAIPIAYDQPGVAARIAYHGVGEFIEIDDLTEEGLAELLLKIMKNPAYRNKARYFQNVIAKTRGLNVAAGIIEQAFHKYQTGTLSTKDSQEGEHARTAP